jgi:hypothetical protein
MHVTVADLAEHVAAALEKGESVELGFYDPWPESANFRPTRLTYDTLRSMKIFTGWVGKYPGCVIISQGQGEPEAVLIFTGDFSTSGVFTSDFGTSGPDDD